MPITVSSVQTITKMVPETVTESVQLASVDIDQSGTVDVAADLMAVIAAAPDGTPGSPTVIDLGGGRFWCEGGVDARHPLGQASVAIKDRHWLTIRNGTIYTTADIPAPEARTDPTTGKVTYWVTNGNGKPVSLGKAWESTRKQWQFTDCTNIRLENLHAVGTNDEGGNAGYAHYSPAVETEHGFEFNDCTDFVVTGCSSTGAWGDGFNFGPGNALLGCTRFTVDRNTVAWNGRQGMAFVWCDDFDVTYNKIVNSKRAAFDLEPNDLRAPLTDIRFKGNDTNSINMVFPMRGHAAMDRISIADHVCRAAGMPRVYVDVAADEQHPELAERSDISVAGWIDLDTSPASKVRYMFEFVDVKGVSVTGVVATLQAGTKGRAVKTTGCTGVVIGSDDPTLNNQFVNGKDISTDAPDAVVAAGQFV